MSWFRANLRREIPYYKYFSLRFTATARRKFSPDFGDIPFYLHTQWSAIFKVVSTHPVSILAWHEATAYLFLPTVITLLDLIHGWSLLFNLCRCLKNCDPWPSLIATTSRGILPRLFLIKCVFWSRNDTLLPEFSARKDLPRTKANPKWLTSKTANDIYKVLI